MSIQYNKDTFEDVFAAIPAEIPIDELTEIYVQANELGVKLCTALDARTDFRRTYDSYWEYICNSIVTRAAMTASVELSGCVLWDNPSEVDIFIDCFMAWFFDNKDDLQLRGDAVRQLLIS